MYLLDYQSSTDFASSKKLLVIILYIHIYLYQSHYAGGSKRQVATSTGSYTLATTFIW